MEINCYTDASYSKEKAISVVACIINGEPIQTLFYPNIKNTQAEILGIEYCINYCLNNYLNYYTKQHIDKQHIDKQHIDKQHIDKQHIDKQHIDKQILFNELLTINIYTDCQNAWKHNFVSTNANANTNIKVNLIKVKGHQQKSNMNEHDLIFKQVDKHARKILRTQHDVINN